MRADRSFRSRGPRRPRSPRSGAPTPKRNFQKATKELLDQIAHPQRHLPPQRKRGKARQGCCRHRQGLRPACRMVGLGHHVAGPAGAGVLFVELKAGKNTLSADQKAFRDQAEATGALCEGPIYTVR